MTVPKMKDKTIHRAAMLGWALLLVAALTSCGEEQPQVADVTIIPVSAAGSGCPANDKVTVKPFSHADRVAGVRISYDGLLVEKNANTTTKDARKFCEVKFQVRTGGAWQFKVEQSMWLGRLRLYPEHRLDISYEQRIGTGGTIDAKITRSQVAKKAENVRLMTGRLTEAWSPCAATPLISVKSALKITGDLTASDNLFDVTPPGSQTLLLRWRKCG